MNTQYLNLDTIEENRNLKKVSQEDAKKLIDTLYAFSILSCEACNKKDTQHGEF